MKRNVFKLCVFILLVALGLTGCSATQQKAADSYAPTPPTAYRDHGAQKEIISYSLVGTTSDRKSVV